MAVKKLHCGSFTLPLERTLVMGILNVTPDSFYDGGRCASAEDALSLARRMAEDGADIIDVGGESTRPGSEPVPPQEEVRRVVPLIEKLSAELTIPLSVDSYKPEVVAKAIDAGVSMVNDVNGLRSPGMAELVASSKLPVVVMHMQGNPKIMQEKPHYTDVVTEITAFFRERIAYALDSGIAARQLILDPGVGFGKTLEHNLEILRNIREFKKLGFPVLIGASRKSFLGALLDLPPEERLDGSLASAVLAASQKADIVRVHDVAETVKALKVADAIIRGRGAGRLR